MVSDVRPSCPATIYMYSLLSLPIYWLAHTDLPSHSSAPASSCCSGPTPLPPYPSFPSMDVVPKIPQPSPTPPFVIGDDTYRTHPMATGTRGAEHRRRCRRERLIWREMLERCLWRRRLPSTSSACWWLEAGVGDPCPATSCHPHELVSVRSTVCSITGSRSWGCDCGWER